METREARKIIDELKKHPKLANSPGYETEELLKAVDPVYWFLLLMEQPQFAPPHGGFLCVNVRICRGRDCSQYNRSLRSTAIGNRSAGVSL